MDKRAELFFPLLHNTAAHSNNMKVTLLLITLTLAVVLADHTLSESEYQRTFTAWMQANGKTYEAHEFQFRFDTFKTNTDFVNRWDAATEGFEGMNICVFFTSKKNHPVIFLLPQLNSINSLI